jgi:hypothetical protein
VKTNPQGAFVIVDVDFFSPVPAGNDVLDMRLERTGAGFFERNMVECVLDRTGQIVYASQVYWNLLMDADTVAVPAADPVATLGPSWRVKASVEGKVIGAVASTRNDADANHARTRLHIAPTVPGKVYR